MREKLSALALLAAVGLPNNAGAEAFEAGSLIIPMDTTYQDNGMFEAFGLVYDLLHKGVRVHWVIKTGKSYGDDDFVASALDVQTNDVVADHGYRGGPFVIEAADAAAAKVIIADWHTNNPIANVHEASAGFMGDVAHTLVVAPNIAMFADGNEDIARKYMMAAKIPDSTGDPGWPDTSPDMLSVAEVSGPTDVNHSDGALFDENGVPTYCQLMSMHWGVGDAEKDPEVVAEVREYLAWPVHFFAECQAVNAFENLDPFGFFLTENGFEIGNGPNAYDFFEMDTPFGQLDGAFESVGGSEPAFSLPQGDMYKAQDTVLITEQGTPIGENDVWMTGNRDGICPGIGGGAQAACLTAGKVSYLGGHEYKTDLPISQNPDSQGTRLFLNSLFEAPCATEEGFPVVTLDKTAPVATMDAEVTFTLAYENMGPIPILDVVLHDTLPAGSTFVSATDGGTLVMDEVVWDLGNLDKGALGSVMFTVELPAYGMYDNTATIDYRVGLNDFALDSNMTMTLYDENIGGSTGSTGGSATGSGSGTSSTTSASASASGSESSGASDSASASASVGTDSATSMTSTAGTDSDSGGAGDGDGSGCGCRTTPTPAGWAWAAAVVVFVRRRRG